MDSAALIGKLSPPIDGDLARLLVVEFIDLERRYALGDWEPATLNGGQFAEIAARIVYHLDSGNLNKTKGVDPCLKYVEDPEGKNQHSFPERRGALHLCKALRTVYKFRSQRGAVHIDPSYTANELDSVLVVSVCRWVMAEILRLFWGGSRSHVANAIREIVQYPVPAVLEVDGRHLVLRTDFTAEEEILVLLHSAGQSGLTRKTIGQTAMRSPATITRTLQKLSSPAMRQVVQSSDGCYSLTPNGARRIHDELGAKLSIAESTT